MSKSKGNTDTSGPERIAADLRELVVPIEGLTCDAANVRKHSQRNIEAIKGSLKQFGQQKPIVIDSNGVVIAGNGTLEGARRLGWSRIAAVTSELQGTQRTAYAIADNRTTELADWDESALLKQLESLQNDETIDHLVAGFTDDEIRKLIDQVGAGGDLQGQQDNREAEIPECFQVVVECDSEQQQRELYERMAAEGLKCRLLTL